MAFILLGIITVIMILILAGLTWRNLVRIGLKRMSVFDRFITVVSIGFIPIAIGWTVFLFTKN